MIVELNEKVQFDDSRGALSILFEEKGIVLKRSSSLQNVFRGLHIQLHPSPQTKIIRLLEGRIIDLAFDPKTGIVHYKEITAEDDWHVIKDNLAHGFFTLEETAFEYFCIGEYNEKCERCFNIIETFCDYFNISNLNVSDKDLMGDKINNCRFERV
ncbi:dTDP-4-dehydrorhamnose 3,5-epimerase family protein [Octadecabacter sp.]|nr:dTDP-4-dehydrorhamnose 3,5-epimerase family protein [Octadecabacter sp.]